MGEEGILERILRNLREAEKGLEELKERGLVLPPHEELGKVLEELRGRAKERLETSPLFSRAAVKRLKRGVWATIKGNRLDPERSKEAWGAFASKLIKAMEEHGIGEGDIIKIVMEYEVGEEGGVRYFSPVRAWILRFYYGGLVTVE